MTGGTPPRSGLEVARWRWCEPTMNKRVARIVMATGLMVWSVVSVQAQNDVAAGEVAPIPSTVDAGGAALLAMIDGPPPPVPLRQALACAEHVP